MSRSLSTVLAAALLMTGGALAVMPAFTVAAAFSSQDGKITPEMSTALDKFTKELSAWVDEKAIVDAVQAQNKVGPLADMTEAKWKEARRRTPLIDGFQQNPAAVAMGKFATSSSGLVCEAFLNAAQGEKVAFIEKTTSYIHKGKAKFDVAFTTGKAWRGEPEFDESTQTYSVQIAVPVLEPKAADAPADAVRKPIGVMVIGVDLTKLAERAKGAK